MTVGPKGVFALEGDWSDDFTRKGSIRPMLQLLEEQIADLEMIHRDVGTTVELAYYSRKWSVEEYEHFRLLFVAFHGTPGTIQVGDEAVDLETLAVLLGELAGGRVVHFGACSTLRATPKRLEAFKLATGAVAVSGYTKDVDWVEAAAFEMLLVSALAWYVKHAETRTYMEKLTGGLARKLGWVLV